jgi:hypothetical protein
MCVHNPVEARRLEFAMGACPNTGVIVRKHVGRDHQLIITARTDGLICVRCGLLLPHTERKKASA